jgi:predicted ester cyclase
MREETAQSVVLEFYRKALTVNAESRSSAVLQRILADDFESIDSHERKDKATLIKQVEYFWTLIPNLRWEPQDVVVSGEKVVVRSVATGSPRGSFLGMTLDGSKSFSIDTIDIHEVSGDRIRRVHHLEGWAAATRQLGNAADHCIETATFRLKPGIGDAQLLALERRVRSGAIARQPGYISRELAKDQASNTWLLIMRFRSLPDMDAWMVALKSAPEMRELAELMDRDSMAVHRFSRTEP